MLDINFNLVFSTVKLASVQSFKSVWQDFNFGTVFAQILILKSFNDWFKLLTPNVICFFFKHTGYLWLLSRYLSLLGRYFWLLNRYYWLLLVTSGFLSLLLVPRVSNNDSKLCFYEPIYLTNSYCTYSLHLKYC